jgi:chromosome segregation ATPase
MDLLEMLIGQLNDTNKNLTNFTVLVNAWNRLRAMREQYNQTRDALLIILGNLRNVDIAINGLFARISTVTSDAEKVDLHINSSVTWALTVNKNTTESKTDADDLLQTATTLLGRLNGVINSLRLLRERLDANVSNIADITAEAQRILNEILDRDFNTVQLAALDAGVQANVTLEIAEEFQIEGAVFINRTTTLQQRLTDYILLLSEANNLADMAISNVTTTNSLLDDVSSNLTDVQIWLTKLEIEASDINSNLSGTQQLISHAEQAIENATDAYNAAKNISRILDIEIAAISRAVYGYRQNVAEVGPSVLTAVKHSRTIHRHSNTLKRLFNKVKSEAEGPMAKYHAYHCDNITAIVENATRYTVVAIDNDFSDLLRRAKESLQKSEMLHDEGNTLNGTVARTNVAIDETNRLVRESRAKEAVPRNKLHGIIDVQGKLDNDTKSLGRGITDIETKAGRYVKRAKGAQGKVEVLTKDVSAAENDLNNLIKELEEPNRILRETEAQVVEISEHVNEMLELHRQTDQEFERLDGILAGFDDELDKINREIEKAKKAAMLVDVPVSAGQEAAALYAPESVNIPLAYTNVSMVVKAANRRGLLFYMGERKKRAADVNFLAVELTRYKPKVTFGMDGKETPVNVDVSLQDGGWYEIKVLRVATTATVYVKSLEEEESHNVTVNRLGHALFTVGSDGNVFVGGLPSDSSDQVPSNVEQKQFQGCIDHIAVNSQRLPIFAFKEPDPKKTTKVASCSGARFVLEREHY